MSHSRERDSSHTRPRRHSFFGIPDPRPGKADPEQRMLRKQAEEEAKFNWKPLVLVGLLGTTLWGGFNRSLSKCEKRHEEEERMEAERRRRREDGEDRGRERGYPPPRGRDRRHSNSQGSVEYDGYKIDSRRRSEGFRYGEAPDYYERDPRGSISARARGRSRPVSHLESPRDRGYLERYQYYYDPRYERDLEYERPRGRVYRERLRRRDSSW